MTSAGGFIKEELNFIPPYSAGVEHLLNKNKNDAFRIPEKRPIVINHKELDPSASRISNIKIDAKNRPRVSFYRFANTFSS